MNMISCVTMKFHRLVGTELRATERVKTRQRAKYITEKCSKHTAMGDCRGREISKCIHMKMNTY